MESSDILHSWSLIKSAAEVTAREPLYSLERFESKKFTAYIKENKMSHQITRLRRQTLKKMISDPNQAMMVNKLKSITKANSFMLTDIELIGQTVV